MQEEISKHSKKIYKTVKNSEHTLGEKVKEIIIEIFGESYGRNNSKCS